MLKISLLVHCKVELLSIMGCIKKGCGTDSDNSDLFQWPVELVHRLQINVQRLLYGGGKPNVTSLITPAMEFE